MEVSLKTGNTRFPDLLVIVQMLLLLWHGQACLEMGFSIFQ